MSQSSSCFETSDEEDQLAEKTFGPNPFHITNPHFNKELLRSMPLVNLFERNPTRASVATKTEINADAKTAAQVDMKIEEKRKTFRRERRKLALLQQTVQLSQQLLEQKKLMAQSKQQLQHLCQSRVKYVKQHKFWRGHVIADCKSAVVETMCAAKARIQERKMKFNQAVVVAAIEKVAPKGIYISKSPLPPATSKPCPDRHSTPRPRMEESLGTKTTCHLPTLVKASTGNKGDQSIVSNVGDALSQEPLYDISTQTEHCYEDVESEDIKEEDSCYEDIFDSTSSEVLEWDSNFDQFSDDHDLYSENSSHSSTFSDVIDNLSNY